MLLKEQREAIVENRCWVFCGNRELAADVVSRLVLKGRTFDVVTNQ
jgi:hypothetical protein